MRRRGDGPGGRMRGPDGSRRMAGRILLVAATCALLTLAAPAAAHALLLESEPPAGSVLAESPRMVRVVFTEGIDTEASDLRVVDAGGRRVDLRDVVFTPGERPALTVSLPDLPEGAYAARWQALSMVDGHFRFGTVGFAVGSFEPPPSDAGRDAWDPVATAARAAAFLGTALVLAAAAHRLLAPRPIVDPRPVMLAAGALVHAGGVALLAADTARDAGLGVAAFAGSSVGPILLSRSIVAVAAALLAVVWWFRPVRAAMPVIVSATSLAAVHSARLGHASSAGPAVVAIDAAHLLASAAWVGGLLALALVVTRPSQSDLGDAGIRRLAQRFSTWATIMVAITVATGLVVMTEILGPQALASPWLSTAWGRLLLVKWLLLLVMLGLAVRNRVVFIRRGATAHPGFPRTVALEAVAGALVLCLAGALTAVGAPSADMTDMDDLANRSRVDDDEVSGRLAIDPPPVSSRASLVTYELRVQDRPFTDSACGRDQCVWLEVGTYGAGERTPLAHQGGGRWQADVQWREEGTAELHLEVHLSPTYAALLDDEVVVSKAS